MLVGHVDAQLFEGIRLKVLETGHVQNGASQLHTIGRSIGSSVEIDVVTNRSTTSLPSIRLQQTVDLSDDPGEQAFVQSFGQGIATVIGLVAVLQAHHALVYENHFERRRNRTHRSTFG